MGLISYLFPVYCRICGASTSSSTEICEKCWEEIKENPPSSCSKCGDGPFTSGDENTSEIFICSQCLKYSKSVDRISAYGKYEGTLKEAIHYFKYGRNIHTGKRLSFLILEAFKKGFSKEKIDLIIPVPLHYNRLRWREFNQSVILAEQIVQEYDIPIFFDVLVRKRKTISQTNLRVSERMKNIKGAFKIKQKSKFKGYIHKIFKINEKSSEPIENIIENKRILLIDDVLTTGITTNECAKVLKENGAAFAGALTVAKTYHEII